MIAKLIVHGPDRSAALTRLADALDRTEVGGTVTNLAFLGRLARHRDFAVGGTNTGLIARDIDALTAPPEPPEHAEIVAALALAGLLDQPSGDDPWDRLRGFRLWDDAALHMTLSRDGTEQVVQLQLDGDQVVTEDGTPLRIVADGGTVMVGAEGLRQPMRLVRSGDTVFVFAGSATFTWRRVDPIDTAQEGGAADDTIVAPMPGRVTRLMVAPGQRVEPGDALLVLEAMKMEHTLRAPRAGIVGEVVISEGQQVDDRVPLIALESEDG